MKLVSVDRAFKELQNDTPLSSKLFSTGAVYLVKFTSRNLKVPVPRGILSVCVCIYNSIRYSLTKRISFCSSFKALSTDTSFIKIGVFIVRTFADQFIVAS